MGVGVMAMMMELFPSPLRFVGAFLVSVAFGILFRVAKKEWLFCGLTGLIGYLALVAMDGDFESTARGVFGATLVVTLISILLSKLRKTISTNYLTPGIIPYVPGGALYHMMRYIALGDWDNALNAGSDAFIMAVAIAFGIIITVSVYDVRRLWGSVPHSHK